MSEQGEGGMFDEVQEEEEDPYWTESEEVPVSLEEAEDILRDQCPDPSNVGSPQGSASGESVSPGHGFRHGRVDPMEFFTRNTHTYSNLDGASDAGNSNASAASGLARSLPDFDDQHLGHGISPQSPVIRQGVNAESSWVDIATVENFTPLRCMRINLPIKLFRQDAKAFSEWADQPHGGHNRASANAAIASLFSAGTSKGIMCGNHIELQAEDPVETSEGTEVKDKPRGVNNVRSYVYKEDGGRPTPMFLFAIEELTSQEGELLALGVWKFIFDPSHSETLLASKVLAENASVENSLRASKVPALARKQSLQKEAKQLSQLGGLSTHAGLYYSKVTSPSDLLKMLRIVAGNSDGPQRSHFEGTTLPHDTLSSPMHMHATLGGVHTLSPEYCYNAKRPHALAAGLVDIVTGKLLPVQDAQLEPTSYFTGNVFRTDLAARFNMSIMADPFVTNIFDMRLPRPLIDSMSSPGTSLLSAFEELHGVAGPAPSDEEPMEVDAGDESDALRLARAKTEERARVSRFLRFMTKDDSVEGFGDKQTFDVLDPAVACARNAENSNASAKTKGPLDEVAMHTVRIRDSVVVKWKEVKSKEAAKLSSEQQANEMEKINATYVTMTQELTDYHLQRMNAAFICREKRQNIPAGYVAWYDSLIKEVEDNDSSASLAFGKSGVQMLSSDRSPLGELMGWIGGIYTDLCFVDGRQRSSMDIVVFTVFECFQEVTYYTILSGAKGLGKSLRTDRLTAIFPENVFVSAGSSSKRSGMNGTTARNARAHIYDEMPPDMLDTKDSMRQEFYKQIATKRFYVHERTEKSISHDNGLETMRSVANETDHKETHIINTNHGVAFTDEKSQDPDDSRSAFVDRAVFDVVRNAGVGSARTEQEFNNNMELPENQRRLHGFRLFMSIVAMVMASMKSVPFLNPGIAHANAVFDRMDKMLSDRFSLPLLSARKKMRRQQTLITLCVMDAVARVYMFKQTAFDYSVGRPYDGGGAPKFHIKHLGEVVRNVVARPETILLAWSYGLDLSVATHPAGSAAMTALCSHSGIMASNMLVNEVDSTPKELSPPILHDGSPSRRHTIHEAFAGQSILTDVRMPILATETPMDRADVLKFSSNLSEIREARAVYRQMCSKGKREAMSNVGKYLESNAQDPEKILPSQNEISLFHDNETMYRWCQNQIAPVAHGPFGVRYASTRFVELDTNKSDEGADSPTRYDFSMFGDPKATTYKSLAYNVLKTSHFVCEAAGLTASALRDLFWMTGSTDNKRLVSSSPDLDAACSDQLAQKDISGSFLLSGVAFGRQCKVSEPLDCRDWEIAKKPLTQSLHSLVKSNRVPTVQCVASNNVRRMPPLKVGPQGSSFSVNVALDHVAMMAEASTALVGYPGYSKPDPTFSGHDAYSRRDSLSPSGASSTPPNPVNDLPHSVDLLSIFLSKNAADLLVDDVSPGIKQAFVASFPEIKQSALELTSRYAGIEDHVRLISFESKVVADKSANTDSYEYADDDLDIDQVSERLGRRVTAEEAERYNLSRRGCSGATIQGNPCLYSKFVEYNTTAMIEKGFIVDDSADVVKTLSDASMLRSRAIELLVKKGASHEKMPSVVGVKLDEVKPTCFRNTVERVAGKKRQSGQGGRGVKICAL